MTVRRTASVMVLASVLLAAGCGGDDEDEDAPSAPPGVAPVESTSSPSPTATGRATRTPSATPTARPSRVPPPVSRPSSVPAAAGVVVVLQPDGLGLASGSSVRQVPFGSGVGTVTSALSTTLGTGKTRTLSRCGQGPRTQVDYSGFTILLASGRFVGWTESGSPERDLSTADGIALQVTLAEVRQALPDAEVSNGSLGPEFTSEQGVSGFLDGTTAQSRVTQLYSGETCFFR